MLRTLLGSEFQTVGAAKWKEFLPADLRLTQESSSIFADDDRRTRRGWYVFITEDKYGRVP